MITLIYRHLKPYKWYNDLYDKIVEDGAKRWEDRVFESAYDPTEKQLQDLEKILKEKDPKMTPEEVKESNTNLMGFFSIVIGQAYRKMKNKDRKKRIKEWRDVDKAKDERVLNTKPLKGIVCLVCNTPMEYKWSQLFDRGSVKKPDEVVMFLYECPRKCNRKIMFEDGTPWISKEKNLCPVCSAERNTTVTKDNQNKMYFIFECPKCGSRQVEKESE